jgi:hypothetical protein
MTNARFAMDGAAGRVGDSWRPGAIAMLARAPHHRAGGPWRWRAMSDSILAQPSVSVFWMV